MGNAKPGPQRPSSAAGQPGFSWVRGLEAGSLTPTQMESLQAAVDNGEADSLIEAAELLDYQSTHWAGDEPGPQAY